MDTIDRFDGPYHFLSNFHEAEVEFEGVRYPTSEHAYQAAKTTNILSRTIIRDCATPGLAKRAGRKLVVRPDWDEIKLRIMKEIVYDKFTRHAHLKRLLLATGNHKLIEGNTWNDTFWGVYQGKGRNHLGIILMDIREIIRNEEVL